MAKGDRNTKYFHVMTTHRRRCSYIDEIWVENKQIRRNSDIREAAKGFFS